MSIALHQTPATALDLDPGFRFKMNIMLKLAKIVRFWTYPDKKAATSFDEMTLRDVYYWVHKTTNPMIRPEKGEQVAKLINTDKSIVELPLGFEGKSSITFGAGGDLLYPQGQDYTKDILFEGIADLLFEKDISYANLESPITTQPLRKEVISNKAAPVECCSRDQFNILKGYKGKNFTVLNTANNHTADYGSEGLNTTLKALAEEGILDTGTNSNLSEVGQGKIIIKNGIKLGFVSVTFGLNGQKMPIGEEYRINTAKLLSKYAEPELDGLKQQIDHCKSQSCDFIIASLHWGFEFELFPRRKQVNIAHTLIEHGADAIIGNHPHVIQPVEYYRTKRDPNRIAVVAYSLGSLTWGFIAPYLVLSAILNLTISKGHSRGKDVTYIEKADVTPVFRSSVDYNGKIVTRLEKLENHINGRNKRHESRYIAAIKYYAHLVLGNDSTDEKSQDLIKSNNIKSAA